VIKHYLKISFRNLWKYRYQTLVSVAGLAVGFACFAIATFWIRYEISFDSFHKNADRMYCVYRPFMFVPSGQARHNPYPLAGYLEKTFPEIVRATAIMPVTEDLEIEFNSAVYTANLLGVDSMYLEMFGVKVIEGSMDFLSARGINGIAVTKEKALQMFGNESPVGKTLKIEGEEYTVHAVVTGLPGHSNYPFDFLQSCAFHSWHIISLNIVVELAPGIDIKAFREKLYGHTVNESISKLTVVPLTSVHYEDPDIPHNVKFRHIVIFSIAGLLLILCTLFNCLTLFVARFRIRQREFALRTVCGASGRSLFMLMSVEFIVFLVLALLSGLFLIRLIIPLFIEISGVRMDIYSICLELLIYIAVIVLISLLTFLLTFAIFRRKELSIAIQSRNRKLFRRTSLAVQLTVSIGFAFCTTVILKQMYYLHNTGLGFSFKNRGSVILNTRLIDNPDPNIIDIVENKIRQIPEITDIIKNVYPLLPVWMQAGFSMNKWDGKSASDEASVNMTLSNITEKFQEYYELKLVEGEFLNDSDAAGLVLINESAAKAFGWNKAVGKTFGDSYNTYRVKGVIQNIYNDAPTVDAKPAFYSHAEWKALTENGTFDQSIIFKFNEGTWKTCRKKIETVLNTEYPDIGTDIFSAEEQYDKFLKSENTLLKILTLVTAVCMIICIFGFVSIVSLTCEERRKEIAIRKINGATVKDILDIFFREHLILLAVGALIAFPAGYAVMRRWLEEYVVQTEISAWIYLSILLALIMTVVICVGGKVYKTSRENPVNSITKL
jgi:ABC-type antimicrobial peptide transport system permease subunit